MAVRQSTNLFHHPVQLIHLLKYLMLIVIGLFRVVVRIYVVGGGNGNIDTEA